MTATLSCKCGSVQITFPNAVALFACECCCDECYKRLSCYADKGGFPLPSAIAKKEKALPAAYMENKMIIEEGKEKIAFSKLTEDSPLTSMVSTCCHSFLVAQHTAYNGNAVGVYTCFSNIEGAKIERPILRWFVNDWEDEKIQNLDPLPGAWVDDEGNPTGIGDGWEKAMATAFSAFQATNETSKLEGDSFSDLMKTCRKGLIIEELSE